MNSTSYNLPAIATSQKVARASLYIALFTVIFALLAVMLFEPLQYSSSLDFLVGIVALPAAFCHLAFGMRLVWLVKMRHKWLIVLSLLFPIVTLLFLHFADKKATKILRGVGDISLSQKQSQSSKESASSNKKQYCTNCGKVLGDSAKFCGQCATPV